MVEQLPVKRQLSRVIEIEKQGEFGETLTPRKTRSGQSRAKPRTQGKGKV